RDEGAMRNQRSDSRTPSRTRSRTRFHNAEAHLYTGEDGISHANAYASAGSVPYARLANVTASVTSASKAGCSCALRSCALSGVYLQGGGERRGKRGERRGKRGKRMRPLRAFLAVVSSALEIYALFAGLFLGSLS